jgi:hypothetical protein
MACAISMLPSNGATLLRLKEWQVLPVLFLALQCTTNGFAFGFCYSISFKLQPA